MLKVGLTGGIGSGKSEVSARLAERGAVVIDADRIAREVVEPGTPGLAAVVAEFGEDVLLPSGGLDREKVGSIVFADKDRLAALNAIVHPLVGERMQALMDAAPADAVVVYDVPLLVENGLAGMYDAVVVVDAPEETQIARLTSRRGMAEADARSRMAHQATRDQRRAAATHVIDNSGTLDDLRAQVDALWEKLTAA
ncbi:dephospho-CoA kinase [Spirillospora albida]|uniref:dephospho-CoA kinase n=1 Tax=Spirillospora albida TaxID=58123 RepID=UPI0004BF9640|nr:dephospho-CoA kinase [Spirillospora albida]